MLEAKGAMEPYREPRKSGGWLTIVLGAVVFAVFGAVVGYTYVNWDNLSSNTYCTGTCPSPPGAFIASSESQGEHSWRFTYALMAGLAYDVSKSMKVDLGYRYRHIDGGPMFQFDPATAATGASGTQGDDPGFTTHEVRLGLRYSLW